MTVDPRAAWSAVAEEIAARAEDDPSAGDSSRYNHYQDNVLLRDLFPLMDVDGRDVLEVGCGPGGKLATLLETRRPRRLAGADLSPGMVEIATRRLAEAKVEIFQLDEGPYPFADGEFDLVYTCTVLHHNPISVLPRVVEQIARVSSQDVWIFEAMTIRRGRDQGGFFVRHPSLYEGLFAAHGFRVVDQRALRVQLSNAVADLAMRVAHTRHLGRPPYVEGAPVARERRLIEDRLMPLTTKLDPWVPPVTGLRAMHFQRS